MEDYLFPDFFLEGTSQKDFLEGQSSQPERIVSLEGPKTWLSSPPLPPMGADGTMGAVSAREKVLEAGRVQKNSGGRDHYAYSYYPKPVNITKTTIDYGQEKTHMMSARDHSFTNQSTLQEDKWLGLSFMDAHSYSSRGDNNAAGPGTMKTTAVGCCKMFQESDVKNLAQFLTQGDQRSSGVTEASSLLGGSPWRPCGRKGSPYHTGQLHPAVHVADLLQHINQMKTAEGYGFKQEYESFFEGWDAMKKPAQIPCLPVGLEGGPGASEQNSVTPLLDVEEHSVTLLSQNCNKNCSMGILPFLISTSRDPNNYVNAALTAMRAQGQSNPRKPPAPSGLRDQG